MRELTIYNYSKRPEQSLGQIRLTDDGTIRLLGFSPFMQANLEQGVSDPEHETRLTPEDGEAFFNLVLTQYSGAYVRAVEKTLSDVLKWNPSQPRDTEGQFASTGGGIKKVVQVYGLSDFPRTDEPGTSPEALRSSFLKGQRRERSVRRSRADYHDAAATANDAAAEAYKHGHADAGDFTIRAQIASGDAGGLRRNVFRAEEVAKQGKLEKAAEFHAKQAAYHRAKAANWRKQGG